MTVGLSDRLRQEFAARSALAGRRCRRRHVSAQRLSWPSHQYIAIAPNGSVYHHGGR